MFFVKEFVAVTITAILCIPVHICCTLATKRFISVRVSEEEEEIGLDEVEFGRKHISHNTHFAL